MNRDNEKKIGNSKKVIWRIDARRTFENKGIQLKVQNINLWMKNEAPTEKPINRLEQTNYGFHKINKMQPNTDI